MYRVNIVWGAHLIYEVLAYFSKEVSMQMATPCECNLVRCKYTEAILRTKARTLLTTAHILQ